MIAQTPTPARGAIELENGDIFSRHNVIETLLIQCGLPRAGEHGRGLAVMVDEAISAAEEISIATQQQRSASDQVVFAMTQVSEVSGQTSTGAEDGVTAAAQLAALAAGLAESVVAFRTN